MDVLTKEQRFKAMSHIRGKNTSIEIKLRKALWHSGIRYRKNYKKLPGSPDIAITKYKIAIFCDSEFFHGKDWERKLRLKVSKGAHADFWTKKINRNIHRDISNNQELEYLGWTVLRFWGHEIQKETSRCVQVVKTVIQKKQNGIDFEAADFNYRVDEEYEEGKLETELIESQYSKDS